MTLKRAVFLDRDGVLNDSVVRNGKPYPPNSLSELVISKGVKEGLVRLKDLGFLLLVVTNQPDVERGTQTREAVDEINNYLQSTLLLDKIYTCFDAKDGGPRRKPEPGMLLEGMQEFGIDMSHSFMVGDRWRDIEAGRKAGCTSIFIDWGYDEEWPVNKPEYTVGSFSEAIELISALISSERS